VTSADPAPRATGTRRSRAPRVVLTLAVAGGLAAGSYGIAAAASGSPTPSATPPNSAGPSTTPSPGAPGPDATAPGQRRGSRGLRGMFGDMAATGGRVSAVGASSVKVTAASGTATTYQLTDSTSVREGRGAQGTGAKLAVGDRVLVLSKAGANSSANRVAVTVLVQRPTIGGTVTAVSADRVTIRDQQGFTRVVATSSQTTYGKDGATSARSAVTVGARVHAVGKVDANGTTLDASRVEVVTKTGRGPGMGGEPGMGGGPGGRGHGGWGGPGSPGDQGPQTPNGSGTPSPAPSTQGSNLAS